MPRFAAHTVEDAPLASRVALAALQRRLGAVLKIHGGMAHPPLAIQMYASMQHAVVASGTSEARTREAVALAVVAADLCEYCQAVHTVSAMVAGLSEYEAVGIRDGKSVDDPKLTALLAVAQAIATDRRYVDDDTWDSAIRAGWTHTELAGLFAHVAVNIYTNYFNHFAKTEADVPPAPPIRWNAIREDMKRGSWKQLPTSW